MPKVGMDVEQVEAGGNALKRHGATVEGLIREIDVVIRDLAGVWGGRDYDRFAHQWWPAHRTALRRAGEAISGLGQSALNNASEQRGASDTTGGGSHTDASTTTTNAGITSGTPQPSATAQPDTSTTGALGGHDTELAAYNQAYAGNSPAVLGFKWGQCTSWAVFRRAEMGLDGPPLNGHNHGYQMAANLGATTLDSVGRGSLVSYGDGISQNHVMVVESVDSRSPMTLTVSEMNYDGHDDGALSLDSKLVQNPDGSWSKTTGDGKNWHLTLPPVTFSRT